MTSQPFTTCVGTSTRLQETWPCKSNPVRLGSSVSRALARREIAGFRPGFWPQGQLGHPSALRARVRLSLVPQATLYVELQDDASGHSSSSFQAGCDDCQCQTPGRSSRMVTPCHAGFSFKERGASAFVLKGHSRTVSLRESRLGLSSGWCRCSLSVTRFSNDPLLRCLSSDLSGRGGRCRPGVRLLA